MKFLLDTHVFIWLDIAPANLSAPVIATIQDPSNTIYLSLVSIWEIQIKMQLGKLKLSTDLQTTVLAQEKANKLKRLSMVFKDIVEIDKLPYHHRDPFDRLLIAQARTRKLTLLTNDANIQKYSVLWRW
jgi:PIN domain nuclease of toxin-antitoxin system